MCRYPVGTQEAYSLTIHTYVNICPFVLLMKFGDSMSSLRCTNSSLLKFESGNYIFLAMDKIIFCWFSKSLVFRKRFKKGEF